MPLIQALHAQADDWRAVEMARARKLLARGDDVEAVLDALSQGLTQKMLHGTLAELHAATASSASNWPLTVSRLFLRGSATRRQPDPATPAVSWRPRRPRSGAARGPGRALPRRPSSPLHPP